MTTFTCFILRFDEKTNGYAQSQEKSIMFYNSDEINLPHLNEFLEAQTKDIVEVFSDKANKWIKVKEMEDLDHFVNGCYIRVLKESQRKIMKKNKQLESDPHSITSSKEDSAPSKAKSPKELSVTVKSRSNSVSDKSTPRSRASEPATPEFSRKTKEKKEKKKEMKSVIVIPGLSSEQDEVEQTAEKKSRRKPAIIIQPLEQLSEQEKEARADLLDEIESVHEEDTKPDKAKKKVKRKKKESLTGNEVPASDKKDNEKPPQGTIESNSLSVDPLDAELAQWKELQPTTNQIPEHSESTEQQHPITEEDVERWNPDNPFPENIPQFMVDLFRRAKIKKKDLLDVETRRMVYELLKTEKLKQDAISNEGNY